MKEETGVDHHVSFEDDSPPTDYISALVKYGTFQSGSTEYLASSQIESIVKLDESLGPFSFNGPGFVECRCELGLVSNSTGAVVDPGHSSFIPVLETLKNDRTSRCDVCFACMKNGYATCRACGFSVHAACYGLDPKVEGFICDRCNFDRKKANSKTKCHLCLQTDGAMRYSEQEDVWVHSSCIYFAPRGSSARFDDRLNLDKPKGVKRAATSCTRKKCDICGLGRGLMVPCSHPECYRFLHPRCALKTNNGKMFCECVSYKSRLQRQYFVFKATLCGIHMDHDCVYEACQFALKRRAIMRPSGRSSFQKYHSEAEDIGRMITNITSGSPIKHVHVYKDIPPKRELNVHPLFEFTPNIHLPKIQDRHSHINRDRWAITEWQKYFEKPKVTKFAKLDDDLPLVRSHDEEVYINPMIFDDACDTDSFHDGGMALVSADAVGSSDTSGNPLRRPRLIWQRFDIFKRIPFGPAAQDILNANDEVTRRKSIQEFLPLNSYILGVESTDLNEMCECFKQQLLTNCPGINALLESVKLDLDIEMQNAQKAQPSSIPDRMSMRLHVLVDTGIGAGVLIFRVSRRLLEHMAKDTTTEEVQTDVPGMSNVNFYINDETRHIISQVQSELVRNSYTASSIANAKITPGREIDFISGVMDYGLKDDLRLLNSIVNASSKDADRHRIRKKIQRRTAGPEPSLKNVRLEKFITLEPFECELLKRCAFEMSQSTETSLKLAIMKPMTEANMEADCLGFIDWTLIVKRFREMMGDPFGSLEHHQHNLSRVPGSLSKQAPQPLGMITLDATTLGYQRMGEDWGSTNTMRLGKWHWPLVPEDTDFIKEQLQLLLTDIEQVTTELQGIRQHLRLKVLEENRPTMRMASQVAVTNSLIYRYESMDRWSELVNHMVLGCADVLVGTVAPVSTHGLPMESKKSIRRPEAAADVNFCSVCFRCTGTNLNPIYTCSRCFMSCHRNCYGVGRAGKEIEASEYICKRCEYEKRTMGSQWQTAFRSCSVLCAICGRGGGALKRCSREEWCHVFCLVCLMPETACNDFCTLEPWDTSQISPWRSELDCAVCGIRWGSVIKCKECPLVAHPLCAWFHGFLFKATKQSGLVSTLGPTIVNRIGAAATGGLFEHLEIEMQCNAHDTSRDWVQQMSIRNKRFINRDTNFGLFDGKEKRRKITPSQSVDMVGLDKPEMINGVLYGATLKCQVCFGFGALWTCTKCKGHVHPACYQEFFSDGTSTGNSGWEHPTGSSTKFCCDVCKNGDSNRAKCVICRRSSNMLKQIPLDDSRRLYIHAICGICYPQSLVAHSRNAPEEAEQPRHETCEICNSRAGLKLECFRRDCNVKFHPICGLENKYVVEPHTLDLDKGSSFVAFCQTHSLVNHSVGTNVKLLLRFRQNLMMLDKVLVDMACKTNVQRSWLRKRLEILNNKYPLDPLVQAQPSGQ
ncbi:bifunctional Zinc finger [Babesia duncani]|uniref:Bifunctional Zinc finger n=1 Tax=Babesia duncani TaxID=323732 RepID=A0AAD9PLH3_9APIC|nr:bifunctional Zinc finger [Babesia duncani]